MRIAVIGGTGYAGAHIVNEALARGHKVTSVARSAPAEPIEGLRQVRASVLDTAAVAEAVRGSDAVVFSVPGRGEMSGKVRPAVSELLAALDPGVRLGVIGGAGGSLVAPGGPRLIDGDFPEQARAEAEEAIGVLEDLQADTTGRDWFYVHPAAGFGAWVPGERTGHYRVGGDVLVSDADGNSFISGADLAVAVLDELERPVHHRERFTVGY